MFGQMQNTEESMMQKPRKHPYHCQHMWTCKDSPKCPKWHHTALKLTSISVVTLVATVIGLTVWVSHLSIYSCSDNPSKRFSSENGTKDSNCMNLSPRKQHNSTNFIRFLTEQYTRWNLLLDWIEHFSSTKYVDLAGWHPIKSTIVTSEMSFARKYFCDYCPLQAKLWKLPGEQCMDYNSDLSMMGKALSTGFRGVSYILRTYQSWLYSIPSIHFQVCPGFRLSPIQY
nr:uncharacterized protein LOC112584480 isoform X2 [Bubalus bubalis]XP_025138981.1 uncharacterized protein LOC112584480 isoform X2 [Bubalus bubalis]